MKLKLLILALAIVILLTACGNDYPFGHPCNEWQAMFTDACLH